MIVDRSGGRGGGVATPGGATQHNDRWMSPLFRKSAKKLADEAEAQAEIERIKTLRVEDVAMALLPALGPDGVGNGNYTRVQQLCNDLVRDFPGATGLKPLQLRPRVNGALDLLERTGLVSSFAYERSPAYRITELGLDTLKDGTIAQRLGPGGYVP